MFRLHSAHRAPVGVGATAHHQAVCSAANRPAWLLTAHAGAAACYFRFLEPAQSPPFHWAGPTCPLYVVLVTVCGIPNSAEFAFPNTQSVELLRRERRRAVRPSWGEYRDQRHRSKRTNVVRTRGELGKADADVSKDAPFDARRPPDRAQSTRGHPTYNKSLFY